jgi:hypothetical protein
VTASPDARTSIDQIFFITVSGRRRWRNLD